jgi:azurin
LILTGCSQPKPPSVAVTVQTDGDFMVFKPTQVSVPAGAQVTLTFHHAGTIITQSHDWVLTKPGAVAGLIDDISRAAAAVADPEGKSFLKPGDPRVLAATAPVGKGQTTTITFTAPQTPGDYPFFCSTPGHGESMQGVMHVVAR